MKLVAQTMRTLLITMFLLPVGLLDAAPNSGSSNPFGDNLLDNDQFSLANDLDIVSSILIMERAFQGIEIPKAVGVFFEYVKRGRNTIDMDMILDAIGDCKELLQQHHERIEDDAVLCRVCDDLSKYTRVVLGSRWGFSAVTDMDIVTSANNSNITIDPHGSGTLALGSADNTAVTANALAITLTSVNALNLTDGTATFAIGGTGATSLSAATTVDLDSTSTMSLNSSGGVINIGNDAVAQNINVGTGAAARTVTIGNTTGATAVNVNLGTGGMEITQVGDSGVGPYPQVKMHNNSASPAANDFLAGIYFDGDDSAGNQTTYARVQARIKDPTSTTEDGALAFYTMIAGTETLTMDLGMSGNLMATFRGSLVPSDANTYSLGITDLEWSDLYLGDGAVLGFGNDQDVTLTHVADTGLLLNSTRELQFRDSALKIWSSADGQLDVSADTEVQIATAAFDVNATGAVTIDGATMSVKGTGASVYGDDVATWDFDGAGAVTETGMTNLTVTPSGTLTMQGAGVSKYGDDVATWDFDGAGAVTEAGMTNFTVTPSGTLTMQGGGASKYGDDTATLDFDGAGAVSETGMTTIAITPSSTVDIDAGGALTIDSASTIGIGTDAVAQNINIGTGAAARTITIGNTTGATAVNVNLGTGGMTIAEVGDSLAGPYPQVKMHNNSSSPAANDFLAGIYFDGDDSAGNQTTYARVQARIKDPTSTTEDGALAFYTMIAGTETLTMDLGMSGNLMATFRGSLVPSDANTYSLGITDLEWSDLYLGDGAVLGFGNDQDVTLTHVADTGLLLNSTRELQFRDSALKIWSSADGQLDVSADTEVQIATAAFDVNATGAVTIDGATMSVKGTGASVYGDDVATWDFDGAGAVTETGMTNLTVTPSGTLTMQGAGVSKYGDDVATWDFDGAGAVTEAGMTNFTVTPSGTLTMQGGGASKYGDDTATLDFDGAGAVSETGMTTIALTPSSTVDIDAGGALTIDSASTIGIGTDAVAQSINVGTGAAARTITIGNTTGATAVNVNLGTGGMAITQVGDSGVGPFPQVKMHNNSASPAANDFLAGIYFDGDDSAGNQTTYARVQARIKDPTSTTEDGALAFYTMIDGTETLTMDLGMSGNLMATFRGSLVPSDANTYSLGITDLEWSDLYLGDGAVLGFGNDQDVTLTHVADTGLLLNSTRELQFRDSALKIWSSADGQLDVSADTEVQIATAAFDVNATGAVTIDGATMSVKGTGASVYGDDVATWDFDGAGAVTETGMTNLTVTPSGTLTMQGAGVSKYGDDVATWDFDGAGAVTEAGMTNFTVTPSGTLTMQGAGVSKYGDDVATLDFDGAGALSETGMTTIAITPSSTVDIDAGGALTIDSASTIGIGTDAVAQNINVGTGAAARTITIGNTTGSTAVNVNLGTGGMAITQVGDSGSGPYPQVKMHNNSSSPAANDFLAGIYFDGEDSASNQTTYARVQARIKDPTSTTEDGALAFYTMIAGTETLTMDLGMSGNLMATFRGSLVPSDANTYSLGITDLEWSDLYLGDGAVLGFGNDQDVTLTHVADTGLLLNSSRELQFRDSALKISSSADGQLDIDADTEIEITAPTVDINASSEVNVSGAMKVGGALTPNSADGSALGSAALEWSDLFLADGAAISLGNTQDATITHDTATDGLDFKRVATSANTPMILTLQTGSTAVVASDVIGAIDFQAPDEAGGTDSILIAAGIEAVSEGTFGAANNATKLSFKTAASEAAAEKMRLSSTGVLTLNGGSGSIIIPNSGTIGSVGTTDAITIASDGVVALKITDGGTIGSATTPAAITIASDGVVTFVDDVLIKNAGTIGSAGDPDAISISSGGVVAVTATTASSSSTTGALTVGGGLGVAADLWVGDDVSLASDSAVLSFGATSDATITHDSATDGLDFKRVATAANTPMILTLQTGSTAVVVSDVIGAIDFQAPDEAGGTDAILIAAGIEAVSEGTFGIANNATKLSFKTAASEAAAEKMSLSSTGVLTVKGSVVPSVADAAALGSATLEWSDLFLADGSVINLGNDQDVKLTHIADTGVRLNDAMALQFRDSAISIASSADGQLDIDADTKLDVVAPTVDFTSTVAVLATTPSVIIDSATASKPLFELKNTTNDTAAAKFRFVMDKGAAGAAGDLSGTIEFYADDTLQNNQEFARVEAKVKTATSGAEDGSLIFYTARTDGTLTKMMDIGDTAVDTITVRSDVLPSGDNLYKSGSSSAGWSAVYSSTGFFESSDRCLKRDIMMSDLGLDFINDLNPVSYRRISGKNPKASYGLIAQELEEVVTRHGHPDFAGIHRPGGESEKYGVAYSSLIAPLIRSVQELSSRSEDTQVMYEDMQTRYEAVQAQYESMQAQIDDLRKKLKKDKKDK